MTGDFGQAQEVFPLESLIKRSRILVTVGSGGVGKTTTSILLAFMAAQMGKRVGLLSIDPAKRLADALGIPLGSELARITLRQEVSGSIEAAMLDQKSVFDDMVKRFASDAKLRDKIFQNSIYQEVSRNLGGPLEYMALAKLESMIRMGSYDLIILDTPPDTHALDFLSRPNVLAGFIENGVMSWMIKPFHLAQKLGAGALLKAGGKVMNGISSVTGVKMLRLLAEFLVLMEDVIIGFNRVGREVATALQEKSTGFILVSAPYPNAIRSAKYILKELKNYQYPLSALILNRNMPQALIESMQDLAKHPALSEAWAHGLEPLQRRQRIAQELSSQLYQEACQVYGEDVLLLMLEEQKGMLHSEESLWQCVESLKQAALWSKAQAATVS